MRMMLFCLVPLLLVSLWTSRGHCFSLDIHPPITRNVGVLTLESSSKVIARAVNKETYVENYHEVLSSDGISRRGVVGVTFASLGSALFPTVAAGSTHTTSSLPFSEDLDCLKDLPSLPEDGSVVRVYLCRHGQTENNRLRKVQGARVDPPINVNGRIQAQNAGSAILRAPEPKPSAWFSSDLQRAQMTAEIIATESSSTSLPSPPQTIRVLREVDFGPVAEGQPVATAKEGMDVTYAAWANGNIDYRPTGGGESGREVSLVVQLWSC